jgi:phosphoribosylanthranilate isomerase
VWIKICGVTNVDDARLASDSGADAVGVNLVPASPRSVAPELAREIAGALPASVRVVAVVADLSASIMAGLRSQCGIRWLQLHGSESPETLAALLPDAYKAVRISDVLDAEAADRFPGELVLADAKVKGVLGGSGVAFDWRLVTDLARRRRLVLAGGLDAGNVGKAVREVRPFGVDVASGVERDGDPRRKDPEKIRRFVAEARQAAGAR